MAVAKKILITGSSGFVGQNLLPYFAKNPSLELIPVSLRGGLQADLPLAKCYVHLAAKAHDQKKTSEDQEYFKVNYELTKQLFDHFMTDRNAETFIFISSVKAVKDDVKDVLTEETNCDPITAYGKSKLMAEQYIMANQNSEKRIFILRPCMIHGPSNKGNLNLLYNFVKKGLPWPLGSFHNKRSFLSIDNLLFAVNEAVNKKMPSGVYNLADDDPFSTNELITMIAQSLGKKPKIWRLPKSMIEKTALIGGKLRLPLNRERLQKLTESYVVSNQKIKTALGISAMPVSAQDGMMKTLLAFKGEVD